MGDDHHETKNLKHKKLLNLSQENERRKHPMKGIMIKEQEERRRLPGPANIRMSNEKRRIKTDYHYDARSLFLQVVNVSHREGRKSLSSFLFLSFSSFLDFPLNKFLSVIKGSRTAKWDAGEYNRRREDHFS